ncbi:TonB-dependent receptor [candidate division KSB1 bacterium]|nr:TonB-dependent receptor [candidate division KSB1 bacterium]
MRRTWFLFLLILLVPALLYSGTTGKIAGVVKDKETGDPLPGANVVVMGTTLGAASDLNGEYVILNVPVGTYEVRATFIGYNTITFSNIRVSADLTTELNFDLSSQAIGLGEITIVGTRPLINKGATNSIAIKTAEEIKNLPLRGFRDVVRIEAGVTNVGGRLYVRGGRREEIATYIDGVYQNNPLTGRASGDLANNAIEEVNYQAGGFNAEYGFANSGVILTTTKAGGSKYAVTGEVITDSYLSQKDKLLGTYSYGYNVYNLAVSGPIPGIAENKVKFYLGGERRFLEDATPSGFAYRQLKMDSNGNPFDANGQPITFSDTSAAGVYGINVNDAFPGDGRGTTGLYKLYQWEEQGPWPDNASSEWLWNGNITIDMKPLLFKIGGNSQRQEGRLLAGFAPGADIQNNVDGAGIGFSIWNSVNNPVQDSWRDSYYAKVTHALGTSTFYSAQINYFRDKFVRSSIAFGDNFWNAGDASNVDIGPSGPQGDGITNPYITQQGTTPPLDPRSANLFASLGTQPGLYWKQGWTFWGFKGDITHQIGRKHELKAGLEYRYNTYRNYIIGGYGAADLHSLAENLRQVGPEFTAEQAYQNRFVDNFGYDIFGNEISGGGRNAAKHPKIAAAYLQDKIELRDLVLNVGLRWDYFDPASDGFRDVEHVITITGNKGVLDLAEENFVKKETRSNFSPRLGFSYPVTDRTVFHAQYGKFVQTPELNRLYTSTLQYAQNLQSGNFFTQENPNLAPIRTTAYEVGFRQQLGDNAALDITSYYKEIRDYVRLVNLDFATPVPYAIYLNQDYGTVKGLSLTFNLRRTNRVSGSVNYTLQYAAGTGSDANTFYNIAWQQGRVPTFVAPLDFDQRHTGSANFDFRTNPDDGPTFLNGKPLGNVGLNLLFTFGSGLSYTPVRVQTEVLGGTSGYFPIGQVGSATGPWTYQLDVKLDKTIKVQNLAFTAYLWAINVTNALNATWVYPGTGEPDNDGYLDTVVGKNFLQTWGPNGVELYKFLLRNPNMVGPPRQLRLGLQFNI